MNELCERLSTLPVFKGITTESLEKMVDCFHILEKKYIKDTIIFSNGDSANNFYIILSGQVLLYKDDSLGNRNIIGKIGCESLLGEAYALTGNKIYPFTAVTVENTSVLVISSNDILHPCHNGCMNHMEFYRNLLLLLAKRNRELTEKITITSQKTTRAKILSFLCHATEHGSKNAVTIQYNRQELSDYLGVERSAMCAELSRMQKDHLITYHKNHFEICPKALSAEMCFADETEDLR